MIDAHSKITHESIPALDSKTGLLLPPVSCSAGQCDWLYNDRGYQCPASATWCSPCLMEGGRFQWWKLCDVHKDEAEKQLQLGGDPTKLRSNWQRLESP